LAAAVKQIGRNVTGIQGDVSNLGNLDQLFAQSSGKRADSILCSPMLGREVCRLRHDHRELYDWTFDINVKGLLFTVQEACPSCGWRFYHPEFIRRRKQGYQSIAFTAPPKPPFVRSRGRGQPT